MNTYNQIDKHENSLHSNQLSTLEEEEADEESNKKDEEDGSTTTSTEEKTKQTAEDQEFVRKESRYVFLLRIIVVVILVLAATAVCVVIYHETTSSEYQEFHSAFDAAADKVTDTFMEIARDKMGAAGSLVVAIVAHGIALENTWPFVALSSFQQRAATVMRLSGALYIGMNPLVTHDQRKAWENYSRKTDASNWYQEGRKYQMDLGFDDLDNRPQVQTDDPELDLIGGIANHIYSFRRSSEARAVISPMKDMYLPVWQTSPVTGRSMVNQDRASNSEAAMNCLYDDEIVFEGMHYAEPGFGTDSNPYTAEFAWLLRMNNREETMYEGDIFTTVYLPLYNNFSVNRTTVGVMRIVIQWARYFRDILPENSKGVVFVLENNCDDPFTYQIDGGVVTPLGHGDLHDVAFDYMKKSASFEQVTTISDGTQQGLKLHQDECQYMISVYPSADFLENHTTNTPAVVTVSVGFVFLFAIFMFFIYDRLVEKRQGKIMVQAQRTHAIVAELFPEKVRHKLLDFDDKNITGNHRLQSFLHDNSRGGGMDVKDSTVIADLFPHASVLFADISGFTAWSSSREPAQVFVLLQNIYKAFDDIARRRKVFKVETIGDSYVAVTGLPDPQPKHALIITLFAAECLGVLKEITQNLESTLGPDTADLSMRFGIHSGPVTAGVLRGERSRFQLFGDVVNTASRMESTGITGRIQISESTAELLKAAGKEQWIKPRKDQVLAKGKGVLKTYWATPEDLRYGSAMGSTMSGSVVSGNSINAADDNDDADSVGHAPNEIMGNELYLIDKQADALLKRQRMVDWVVQLLSRQIEIIVSKQQQQQEQQKQLASKKSTRKSHGHNDNRHDHRNQTNNFFSGQRRMKGQTAIDEVVEAIKFPKFDFKTKTDAPKFVGEPVQISDEITTLLRKYVAIIADAHRENAFHNFERTCHVLMQVSKFLNRMAMFDLDSDGFDKSKDVKKLVPHLHDYTRLIVSDPVVVLASLMASLVHDVDHRGVPNAELVKEEPQMARYYKEKSVAEQNSLEVSWTLFMASQFKPLRQYIFSNAEDLSRFRQVLVNCLIATDICDKELVSERHLRYGRAFSSAVIAATSSNNATTWGKDVHKDMETNALRATITLENIIQAGDIFYALQHWHVFQRWNESKFHETMRAYQSGRVDINPVKDWYQNELDFFDQHVIPLAQNLKNSGVFGVCSDECLSYAERNRDEWKERGKQLVRDMLVANDYEEFGDVDMNIDVSSSSLGVNGLDNIPHDVENIGETRVERNITSQQNLRKEQQQNQHIGVDIRLFSTHATSDLSSLSVLHQ